MQENVSWGGKEKFQCSDLEKNLFSLQKGRKEILPIVGGGRGRLASRFGKRGQVGVVKILVLRGKEGKKRGAG